MQLYKRPKIRCFLIIPLDRENRIIRESIRNALRKAQGILISLENINMSGEPWQLVVSSEINRADLVVAEVSKPNPNIFYEIGLAHAMGKPTVFLIEKKVSDIPLSLSGIEYFVYTKTPKGIAELQHRFIRFIENFRKLPRSLRLLPFPAKFIQPSFIIDLEKLEAREFENLCFELLTQMGFRRIEWAKALRPIDAVATFPKKDPDGYEYNDLWFIYMGRHLPTEVMLDIVAHDPDYFIRDILRHPEAREKIFPKVRLDTTVTLLIILRSEKGMPRDFLEYGSMQIERRIKDRKYQFNLRIRLWDQHYITSLIQQYPQIGYKYFSDEVRDKSKYRKTSEELYLENVKLTEKLQLTVSQFKEEKEKRFIAERDAAWKDVAFKAAHKLGNPLDAVETYLKSLMIRIEDKRNNEAIKIIKDMGISIEEAKAVIAQFKSLTKSQEINARSEKILPLIERACHIAKENGVKVQIHMIEDCPSVFVDPDKISECFNELVANSLHWFDKEEKMIKVSVGKISKRELPDNVDSTRKYLKILYEDNGCGIPLENKEKIFSPFYTTYPHGSGLGLSLVKWIIEGHGGTIYENGKPGKGVSFEILLPIATKKRKS